MMQSRERSRRDADPSSGSFPVVPSPCETAAEAPGRGKSFQSVGRQISTIVLLSLLFFALLYARRSAQLLHPQVWDEDGTRNIPGLMNDGLKSLFYPVNGYLIVVPKVITAVSLAISGLYYPLISTIITWLFIVYVCIAISVSPTWLKGGLLLGVFTLLIPSDPEVFGIPLYSFWWASLLLFLVVLWDPESTRVGMRVLYTVAGGLSSPVIFIAAPLLACRVIFGPNRKRELTVLATAVACCFAQGVAMAKHLQLGTGKVNAGALHYVLPEFVGSYFGGNFNRKTDHLVWIDAAVFLLFLLMAIPFLRRRPQYLYLFALWCGSVAIVARRVDLAIINTRYAAPRYFFLPFALMSWFLVSVMVENKQLHMKVFAAVLLLAAVLNMRSVRTHAQRDFQWAQHLAACAQSDHYSIPISYNGQEAWFMQLDRKQCRALQRAGLIHIDQGR